MIDVSKQIAVTPLNLSGKRFCERVGIAYERGLLKQLRELGLVGFFKVGKKYMYPSEDTLKLSEKLRKGEISIRTDNGYYITINE